MADKKKIRSLIVYIAFGLLAAVSLYFAIRDKDLRAIGRALQDVDYRWAGLVLVSSLCGSLARALRWQQLLQPLGQKPPLADSFFSLMFGYLINIFTPRAGEVSRSLVLQETTGIHFAKSFGTVVTERVIDLICLAIVVMLALLLQLEQLGNFYHDNIYIPLSEKISALPVWILLAASFAGIIFLSVAFYFIRKWRRKGSEGRVQRFFKELWEGLISIAKLENPFLFLLYTFIIWASYFFTSYLWFFAFDATQNLTVAAAFTVMAVGAIAKSLPIQGGGIGAYHYLISQLLQLYQITGISAIAYATLNHGAQMVYNIVLGLISLVWMYAKKRPTLA